MISKKEFFEWSSGINDNDTEDFVFEIASKNIIKYMLTTNFELFSKLPSIDFGLKQVVTHIYVSLKYENPDDNFVESKITECITNYPNEMFNLFLTLYKFTFVTNVYSTLLLFSPYFILYDNTYKFEPILDCFRNLNEFIIKLEKYKIYKLKLGEEDINKCNNMNDIVEVMYENNYNW